jgi:hypothetical protein
MSTKRNPDYGSKPRQVKVTYKVKAFYAHCPACGIARQCRHEADGTFTLICGCRRDGANRIQYLINSEDVVSAEETRTRYFDVPNDGSFEMIEE